MTLEERLKYFDNHFHYNQRPELFAFDISPERIAYRNEALRRGDREIYAKYLAEKYAKQLEKEMESFDLTAKKLVKISKDEASKLFEKYQVNLLKSDISFMDNDAIYSMYKADPESIGFLLESYREELIDGFVPIEEAFINGRQEIFLDKSGILSNI